MSQFSLSKSLIILIDYRIKLLSQSFFFFFFWFFTVYPKFNFLYFLSFTHTLLIYSLSASHPFDLIFYSIAVTSRAVIPDISLHCPESLSFPSSFSLPRPPQFFFFSFETPIYHPKPNTNGIFMVKHSLISRFNYCIL